MALLSRVSSIISLRNTSNATLTTSIPPTVLMPINMACASGPYGKDIPYCDYANTFTPHIEPTNSIAIIMRVSVSRLGIFFPQLKLTVTATVPPEVSTSTTIPSDSKAP